jgi:hypothetical protein
LLNGNNGYVKNEAPFFFGHTTMGASFDPHLTMGKDKSSFSIYKDKDLSKSGIISYL